MAVKIFCIVLERKEISSQKIHKNSEYHSTSAEKI